MTVPAERITLTDTDYAGVEQMLAPYRDRLLPQAAVVPHWSDDGARFW
ncbi:hypothetical protein HGA13_23590 [Nocardia speluncae]|uniref:Uncharacterized protein n=1 Tax=Nocardia speluncae TaxID=419477 RepID=A0A846XQX8_9NOCA|nr:hypothetical protein [Nocardia speluncae]NKY36034.1 hypothetical protein [Nocardia speluncae]